MNEALGERFWQPAFADLGLRPRDVVVIPAKPGLPRWEVELEPGRPGVAVARLADRTGGETPTALVQLYLRAGRGEIALEPRLDEGDRKRDVAVADEDDRRDSRLERGPCRLL